MPSLLDKISFRLIHIVVTRPTVYMVGDYGGQDRTGSKHSASPKHSFLHEMDECFNKFEMWVLACEAFIQY